MANFLIGGIQGSIKAFQGDFGPLLKTIANSANNMAR
jgi:hypothetical protein